MSADWCVSGARAERKRWPDHSVRVEGDEVVVCSVGSCGTDNVETEERIPLEIMRSVLAAAGLEPSEHPAVALLREIEHVECIDPDGGGIAIAFCPACDAYPGHAPDCRLAAILAGAPAEHPARALVEALYRLRRTLSTVEQRDALRAVERVVYQQDEGTSLPAKEIADHKAWLRENAASVTVPEHPAMALLREIDRLGNPDTSEDGRRFNACVICEGFPGHAPGCSLAAILASSKPGTPASGPFEPTEAQAHHSPLLMALYRRGTTERDVIEALFQRLQEWERIADRLAAFQPMGPIVVDGVTWTNPTADKLAAEGHARTLSEVLAEERAKGAAEEREAICAWMSAEWGTQERTETNDLIGEVVQNIRDGQHVRGPR